MEKLKVFISSTFLDLRDERDALSDLFNNLGIDVLALDTMPSSGDSAQKIIAQSITKCDLVILILGSRYGALLSETKFHQVKNPETCSVTKWEYLNARQKQKPVLIFIKNAAYDQLEKLQNPLKEKFLNDFKSEISYLNIQYFNNVSELTRKAVKSIIANLYNSKNDGQDRLKIEIEALKNENATLKGQLNKQHKPVLGLSLLEGNNSSIGLSDLKPLPLDDYSSKYKGIGGLAGFTPKK